MWVMQYLTVVMETVGALRMGKKIDLQMAKL